MGNTTRGNKITRRKMLRRMGEIGVLTAGALIRPISGLDLTSVLAASAPSPRPGGTLTIAMLGSPVDIVPSSTTATNTQMLVYHVYEGLVDADRATGVGVRPGLAKSWRVSPNGKVYTFFLRQGIKFHDGTDFNAEAVALNFERLRKPSSPYYYKVGGPVSNIVFNGVDSVEIADPYTVRYHLSQPNGDFLYLLKRYQAALISPAAIKQFPPEEVVKHPSGTGPYRLVRRDEGSRIVFERFDKYWASAPYLERLIYRTYTDENAREAALLSGEVDMTLIATVDMVNRFKGRLVPAKWGVQEQFVVRLNARHPFTKDMRVRQALNYALNRDELVKDLYRGAVTEARGPYSPSNPGWNPSLQGYRYDPPRAKQLFTEAGFGAGAKVRAIIPTNAEFPMVPEVTQIIQAHLRKVGVDLSYDTMEWGAYLAKLRAGLTDDHIFMVTSWGADYMFWLEQQLGKNFWPPNGSNLNWYTNPEVEKLFESARLETRDQARKKLYQQAEELITRDAAWLFTFYQPYFALHTPKLQGIGLHYWGFDFSKAWLSV